MLKNILLIVIVGFISLNLTMQKGLSFPSIEGETLSGKQVKIPESTQGKITIVGMAYSKKSEAMLKTWFQPMYNKFIAKSGMFDADYDVNIYFIPMFTGTKKLAYGKTIKKLKESSKKDLHPYVMFYKGELEPYVTDLKMERDDLPYFFVLDEDGEIIYTTKGFYNDNKMEVLEEAIENNL